MNKRLVNQPEMISISQILGAIFILLGVTSLIFLGMSDPEDAKKSTLAALSFFFIMLGMAFFFPGMLKNKVSNEVSNMRIASYMIVCIFILLSVKIGWACNSFEKFTLDSTWAWILGVALGSKTIQSLGETNALFKMKDPKNSNPGNSPNHGPLGYSGSANIQKPVHDSSTINNPAPSSPPQTLI